MAEPPLCSLGSFSTYQQLHGATDHDLLQAYVLGKEDPKAKTPLGRLVSLINAVVYVSTAGSGKTRAPQKIDPEGHELYTMKLKNFAVGKTKPVAFSRVCLYT